MAKIIIAGDAVVVESSATLEQIKTLEKYRPEALCLYDDNKNVKFKVGTTTGAGSINGYGASFGSNSKNASPKASITMMMPADTVNAQQYAEETIGVAILRLNEVEAQFQTALGEVTRELADIRANITLA